MSELISPESRASTLGDDEFLVVGVGASAGGVEALESLFSSLPEAHDLAMVVVQHLSPDFESLMPQIISRRTRAVVMNVDDGTRVARNHVYVLQEGKEIWLADGCLRLKDRSSTGGASHTIDRFFSSLAAEYGRRAAAVVLSGTGSDGAAGIVDIHDAGGVVIVQSEDSAKFNGMPRAAIDSGMADVVTAASEIPQLLDRLDRTLRGGDGEQGVLDLIEGRTSRVLQLLRTRYGIDFSQYKTSMLNRRLERRLMLSGEDPKNIEAYFERVEEDPGELEQLFADLLIGVTEFFRDPEAFELMRREQLPKLLKQAEESGVFRVWVTPTATGEEAYSIAMLIDEVIQEHKIKVEVKIFATDAHAGSIEFASRGIYPASRLANVSQERVKRYFRETDGMYHVCRHIRKMVVFAQHNLLSDAPFTALNLVSCRNLLIYLKPPTQDRVLSVLNFGLKNSAVLFLGPNESVSDELGGFECIEDRWRFYRKNSGVSLKKLKLDADSGTGVGRLQVGAKGGSGVHLIDAYDQLIDHFLPPSILVTPDCQVAHIFSGASKFLSIREGRPSSNVLDMLPDTLRVAVANGIKRAENNVEPTVYAGLQCEFDGVVSSYRVTIKPVRNRRMRRTEFLISFDDSEIAISDEPITALDPGSANFERVSTLEEELRDTRESLHASIQELKSANEEMQSTNEELIASNEELQSTNEELHSVNEELYTVNSEHQRKIAELTELTDDMENLLDSIRVDTIFLDRNLKLRKFTLGIARTFRLIPQDVGRRIDSFNHDLQHDGLVQDIQGVLESESVDEKEVQDTSGSWYLMRLLPYTSRGQVDGVLLTLIDITPMKATEQRLAELSEIVEVSDDAIFRVDENGLIRTWNRGAGSLYGHDARDIIGQELGILVADESDRPRLLAALDGGSPDVLVDHLQMRHVRRTGEEVDVAITVSPIKGLAGEPAGASIVIRNISAQKLAQEEVQNAVRRRDEFLAMLSHELRNPLAAIRNADSLLRESDLDEETAAEAREVAGTQLRHLTRLLDDLLDVSRVTNDKLILHLEAVDLQKSMMEATECVQHRMDEKSQQLFVELPNEPLFVLGDVGRLQQAQLNLLVNACKYTPENGKILFKLHQDGDEAVITVVDDGMGVSDDLAQSIFDLFVQSEQSLDRSQGGMGLGLPLVKMIATAHGGTISLKKNVDNRGSVFELRLPLTAQYPVQPTQRETKPLTDKRVLLIEDNEAIRAMLARSLELKGLEVIEARDANEGIQRLADSEPQIAIVDIGLPDVDGYEIARRVRLMPQGQELLMVAVTGYGRPEDKQKAINAGFDAHMVKPIDPSELVSSLAGLERSTPTSK